MKSPLTKTKQALNIDFRPIHKVVTYTYKQLNTYALIEVNDYSMPRTTPYRRNLKPAKVLAYVRYNGVLCFVHPCEFLSQLKDGYYVLTHYDSGRRIASCDGSVAAVVTLGASLWNIDVLHKLAKNQTIPLHLFT